MKEKSPVKIIYKKRLMVELVRRDHNLLYSTKNKNNLKYQCFMFESTPELDKDLAELSGKDYVEDSNEE